LSQSTQCFFQCFATKHLSMPAVKAEKKLRHTHRSSKGEQLPGSNWIM
jgi:hypothetical protein